MRRSQLLNAERRAQFTLRIVLSSETFVAPVSAYYEFFVHGAAGAGAMVHNAAGAAVGGGGAGFSWKRIWLNAGDAVTITLAAGGTKAASATGNGGDGGTTTVVGPSAAWTITITPGKGGTYTTTNGVALTGALGGEASGGDINYNGGQSGDIAPYVTGNFAATAGGSGASIYGAGKRSGSIVGTLVNGVLQATGGASVIFPSPTITASASHQCSSGAGTGFPGSWGASTQNGGANAYGITAVTIDGTSNTLTAPTNGISLIEWGLDSVFDPISRLFGGGSASTLSTTQDASITTPVSGPGAGSGSAVITSTATGPGTYIASGAAGTLGSSGAAVGSRNTAYGWTGASGKPGRGAGSGAVVTKNTSAAPTTTVSPGGDAFVVIRY